MRLVTLQCLVLLGLTAGCHEPLLRKQQDGPHAALIMLAGAKDVQFVQSRGRQQLIYRLEAKYPASDVLQAISDQLEGQGWKPLKEDFLNPGLPSSHVSGWASFVDEVAKPPQAVHQWFAQWANRRGDVVWYALRYSYPQKGEPNLTDLQVISIYTPTRLAKSMLREVKSKR